MSGSGAARRAVGAVVGTVVSSSGRRGFWGCGGCGGSVRMASTNSSAGDPASPPPTSFHKRPLPAHLIPLSSSEGRKIFREALDEGGMESYFPLAEQFITQSDPSFCSISTLAMVMNALNFDLKRVWKGPWRWVTEEMLQCESQSVCGHSIHKVKREGLNFAEFESLARCHGVKIAAHPVCASEGRCADHSIDRFRGLVQAVSSSTVGGKFVVVNYSRKSLGQTGDGHFSPIGGYHRGRDMALVLDVARFKYPPYWVPVRDLWDSMVVHDKATGRPRGFFIVSGWQECNEASSSLAATTTAAEVADLRCPSAIKSWVVDYNPRDRRPCLGTPSEASPSGPSCGGAPCGHNHAHAHAHAHGH